MSTLYYSVFMTFVVLGATLSKLAIKIFSKNVFSEAPHAPLAPLHRRGNRQYDPTSSAREKKKPLGVDRTTNQVKKTNKRARTAYLPMYVNEGISTAQLYRK